MKVYVKVLNGASISLTVTENTTVAELKKLVSQELDVPINKQRLVFKGKPLQDDQMLKSYDVITESRIMLTIKNDGQPGNGTKPLINQTSRQAAQSFAEKRTSSSFSFSSSSSSSSSSANQTQQQPQTPFQQQLKSILLKHFSIVDSARILEQYNKNWNIAMSGLTLDNIEKTARLNLARAS
ncbi:hypothetical protein HELRODRAFT_185563 [Helobdella robusta]|uniref:Ubiquitin-like domain-containing protein n=1 Tax=Helobdella robusta TaxID=6412 RepID=T1FMZ5_HELRO|nr:hypothetical protein HELRODRAFT_185563 [Helobdella robusta]ESO04617.1 hypothetical protein HELRODRAFT_185563 [Helobdella robusta]